MQNGTATAHLVVAHRTHNGDVIVIIPSFVPLDRVETLLTDEDGKKLGLAIHEPEGEWTNPSYRASCGIDPEATLVRIPGWTDESLAFSLLRPFVQSWQQAVAT